MNKRVLFYRTLWGVDLNLGNLSKVKGQLNVFKSQGFDGLEIATGFFNTNHKTNMKNLLGDLNMGVITQIHTMGYPIVSRSVKEHFDDFRSKIEDSLSWNPKVISCHTGRDDWSLEQSLELFRKISEYEQNLKSDIKISHETHRQRVLFNPQISYQIMKHFPDLNYTTDLSHWVVVNSRLCNETTDPNWKEILEVLCKKSVMIHARVSTTDQIQAIDPYSEDNKDNREYFESIWKEIFNKTSSEVLYVDPEYGPYPYAIVNPFTKQPFIPVDEITVKSLQNLKKLFK